MIKIVDGILEDPRFSVEGDVKCGEVVVGCRPDGEVECADFDGVGACDRFGVVLETGKSGFI